MDLAIDCQTLMRMSVSRRIESALGVAHLQQDPTKRPKEDFISLKTLTLIEDAAKIREDLTWAMEARKVATSENSLFGGRPRKSPGGSQRNSVAHGRGQGGAPGITPPVRAEAKPRRSNGTPVKTSPRGPLTNKTDHGPRTGLGYQFDATLGYPGEGPSHSPFTRRGTRPSLRVWSTKRPERHVVDPIRVRLDFNPASSATK